MYMQGGRQNILSEGQTYAGGGGGGVGVGVGATTPPNGFYPMAFLKVLGDVSLTATDCPTGRRTQTGACKCKVEDRRNVLGRCPIEEMSYRGGVLEEMSYKGGVVGGDIGRCPGERPGEEMSLNLKVLVWAPSRWHSLVSWRKTWLVDVLSTAPYPNIRSRLFRIRFLEAPDSLTYFHSRPIHLLTSLSDFPVDVLFRIIGRGVR